jgi:hypothetical protein
MDPATLELITNDEALEVDQHSSGNHESLAEGDVRAWIAVAASKTEYYIAVFNLGDQPVAVNFPWDRFFHVGSSAEVRDLWKKQALGRKPGVELSLAPHASTLYRISNLR